MKQTAKPRTPAQLGAEIEVKARRSRILRGFASALCAAAKQIGKPGKPGAADLVLKRANEYAAAWRDAEIDAGRKP